MENEKPTKQTLRVFTHIIKKLINPAYKQPNGGVVIRTVSTFLNGIEKEYGAVTMERIVDACVAAAYMQKDRATWNIKTIFGPTTLKRLKELSRGQRYFQDRWLESAGLSREILTELGQDRSVHPQQKFLYIQAEENTKRRHLNRHSGYLLCQLSTLGWSPLSECCNQCVYSIKCKKDTELKYPEIYRLRIQYGITSK